MIAVTEWTLGAALEYATVGIPGKVFWSKVEYLGTLSSPVLLLLLALDYNRLDRWLTRRNIGIAFIIPFFTWLLADTNEWHGLIWSSFTPSPAGENLLVYGHGLWFWIGVTGYSYLLMLCAAVLLIWGAARFPSTYRPQAGALVVGALAPWAANLLYVTGLSPAPGLELTPLALVLSGVFLTLGIARFRLLDLMPVARDALIETMAEGMLVLDEHGRIVDLNPAAQRLLSVPRPPSIGHAAQVEFAAWPDLASALRGSPEGRVEIASNGATGGYLEVSVTPLPGRRGKFAGRLIVLRDITQRRKAEEELQRANERLHAQLTAIESLQGDLREQAIRDSLTGLLNRRYLDETLARELARAARDRVPVSLVMLDIDHFKTFNDEYGHKAGDDLLHELGRLLRAQTRAGDIACRYGGEEFMIVMPGATGTAAVRRADQLLLEFEQATFSSMGQLRRPSLSAGVATFPDNGATAEEVARAADLALYASKRAGGNRVMPA
jgi:diguanylate cyclase (GGDEF)-like protein